MIERRSILRRDWLGGESRLMWVMLNPSTADETTDDPTIRRCIGFSQREGFAGLRVVNLSDVRATDPDALAEVTLPRGPDYFVGLYEALAETSGPVVAAWGAHQMAATLAPGFLDWFPYPGRPLVCLGTTKDGHPRHPLYVRKDAPLVPFEAAP